jgi:hypothetical protein
MTLDTGSSGWRRPLHLRTIDHVDRELRESAEQCFVGAAEQAADERPRGPLGQASSRPSGRITGRNGIIAGVLIAAPAIPPTNATRSHKRASSTQGTSLALNAYPTRAIAIAAPTASTRYCAVLG